MKKVKVLVSSILIFAIMCSFCTVYAYDSSIFATDDIQSQIEIMETSLEMENTNVLTELGNLKDYYSHAVEEESDPEEIDKLNDLIKNTDELIADYQNYNAGLTRGKFHIVYSVLVASAVAVFQKANYHLSAELLQHAQLNDVEDSSYYPSKLNTAKIKNTSTYPKMTATNGSIEFPKVGGNANLDCYYALHWVDYLNDWSHKTLEIKDTYDFEKEDTDYSDLTGTAVQKMYEAQEAGVLVPYKVYISLAK